MSPTPSTAKRPRSSAASAGDTTKRPTTPKSSAAVTRSVSADQRHAMIAESAYRRAEARGFEGGDPMQDWLEGEREVDALLSRAAD